MKSHFPIQRVGYWLLLTGMGLVLSSCITDLGEETHFIRFNDLQVGQESRYVRLHGYDSGNPSTNIYVMVPDTLVVRVIGKDAQGYVLEDYLTRKPSERYHPPEDMEVFTYHLIARHDTLIARGESHLFWSSYSWGLSATYPLKNVAGPQISVRGWKLSIDPIGFAQGHAYAANVGINGHFYDRVNVYYWGFEADIFRELEPGEDFRIGGSFIYSPEFGIIRSKVVGEPGLGQGLCWDLIW